MPMSPLACVFPYLFPPSKECAPDPVWGPVAVFQVDPVLLALSLGIWLGPVEGEVKKNISPAL